MSQDAKSLLISYLDRYASLVVQIGVTLVLARLLSPAEIGVYAVTIALLFALKSLRDFGAGMYLYQEKDLTHDRIASVWALQLGTGLAFATLTLALAGPAAWFYGEPLMVDILMVVALNFALVPFGSLTYAWLVREMRFKEVAVMRLSGTVADAAVSLTLAWFGWGPLSMAWGSVAAAIVGGTLALIWRPAHFPWKPGIAEIKRVFTFGWKISYSAVYDNGIKGAPDLILGKLQTMTDVGIFSRGGSLITLTRQVLLDPSYPFVHAALSRAHRDNLDVKSPVETYTSRCVMVWIPAMALLALHAEALILILFGDQWTAATRPAQILCIANALLAPMLYLGTAMAAIGKPAELAKATTVGGLIQLAGIAIGAPFGLVETASSIALATLVFTASWLRAGHRALGLHPLVLLRPALPATGVAIIAAGLSWLMIQALAPVEMSLFVETMVVGLGGLLCVLLMWRLIDHEIYEVATRLAKVSIARLNIWSPR